ncbi:HK97-gp10 family putative phage morphogenesis protein [Litoribrevibacter albus]|uniref:HK97 gp10 family phage protein n=1 Tax=Litoribrevibacter albus TaxID=1473156 RepID=A0AA37W611_9GAMM|nr:HK97-gp10 family putative phage morphogenesis protein [Litoribrevibacter albus]GLQ31662.1 hypothetical protein GCM10007876_21410 [Litoribrevibacter albus]
MDIEFNVEGLKELDDALKELDIKTQGQTMRKALREAAMPVKSEMLQRLKTNWGEKSGALANAITMTSRVVNINSRRAGSKSDVTVQIGPTKRTASISTEAGVKQSSPTYALHLEYGTRHIKARPFMRPALQNNYRRVVSNFKKRVRELIEKT